MLEKMSAKFIYFKDEDFPSEFDQIQAILSEKNSIFMEEDAILVWVPKNREVAQDSSSDSSPSPNMPTNDNEIQQPEKAPSELSNAPKQA